jgi:hypothetical protein
MFKIYIISANFIVIHLTTTQTSSRDMPSKILLDILGY